jgi:hypothetical protein
MQGAEDNIEKTLQQLTELQTKLCARHAGEIKKGKKPTNASVEKQARLHCLLTSMNGLMLR